MDQIPDITANHATTSADLRRRLPPPDRRRAIREAARVSRPRVAAELDVSISVVAMWERGEREPSRRFLRSYVELLERLATISQEADDA